MDGQRFDEITRAFATGTSRRRLLSSVAAGLAGALAGAIGLGETDAARGCKGAGGKCGTDRECCQDDPSRCVAGKCCPTPRYCPGSGVCCDPGLKCCDDSCVSFDTDATHCGGCGVVCASGVCQEGSCLKAQGETCTDGSECASTFCVDGVCCDTACTGADDCQTLTCESGTCSTGGTQTDGTTCGDGAGLCINGDCCPGEDYCGYDGDICCDPNRSTTASCCPGEGGCCECFNSTDPGNEGLFCCDDPTKICGTYPNDTCCHYDEGCFNDTCVWEEKLCEGSVCPNKCCGGECCGPWDTCGFDQNGNEVCHPLPTCTVADQATVCGSAPCVAVDVGVMVCCPGDRLIDLSDFGAPEGTYECCPFGEQPSQGGDPFTCCPGPNFCGTSRGGAIRF